LRRALLFAAVVALLAVLAARADGDPASDYLLSQRVFLPPDDNIPDANARRLTTIVNRAWDAGYPIKVAIIGTRYDLGAVPVLFRKPQRYALFLGQELTLAYRGRLLVAMPNGYGFSIGGGASPANAAAVQRLAPPGTGAALADGAARAVQRLAARSGTQLAMPPLAEPASSDSSANRDRLVLIVATAVLVCLVAAAAYAWRVYRRRRAAPAS
jgi:hypothetical protein